MSYYNRLNDPDLFPREFIKFVDPSDYFLYEGIIDENGARPYHSFSELINHIQNRREALNYPRLTNLNLKIENYLYKMPEVPRSLFRRQYTPDRSLAADIETGAKLAVSLSRLALNGSYKVGNNGFVNRLTANERGQICANCPKNVEIEKSVGIRARNKLAALFTKDRDSDWDDILLDCEACGCPSQEKIHYSEEVIRETNTAPVEEFLEEFSGTLDGQNHRCWVLPIIK